MGRQPLLADKPIIGPIWVRLRDLALSLWQATQLQGRLQAQAALNEHLEARLEDHEARLIDQDRQQAQVVHDAGELSLQIVQLRRRLDELEARLAASGAPDADAEV